MKYLPEEPYRRAAYLVFYIVLGTALAYVGVRYILPLLFPFLIAFAAASLLRRPSAAIAKRLHLHEKTAAVILTVLTLSVVIGLLLMAAAEAMDQLGALAKGIVMGENTILQNITSVWNRLSALIESIPFFSEDGAGGMKDIIGTALSDVIKNAFLALAARLPDYAGRMVALVPKILFSSVVTILSAVYFSADYEKIVSFVKRNGKGILRTVLREIYGQTGKTLAKYVRSHLILLLFTFAELFLGFLILGERYAFLLAATTAVVDILPVLGTGTVLIPWALYLFFAGEIRAAIGLLILYAVVTVLRQFLEPRIVGAGIGISPLLSLSSMYVGWRLFGVSGILFVPFIVVMIKNTVTAFRASRHREETP